MKELQISPQQVNPQAVEVCRVLHEAGYEAFIVGGCVRDLLLKQIPKDWDIATSASPENVIKLFPKTYPTGLQHGTVTVAMGEGPENHFEVTTFRIEGEYLDGRRPESVFFVMHIEQDLARRDLTINAIAYDPILDRVEDPFNGFEDLKDGIIRAVGKADARFKEDGLRIMRVARFAARFGYQVEQETLEGMKRNIETLKKVSMERIRDELCKTLMTKKPYIGLKILQDCGALFVACPLLEQPSLRHFMTDVNKCQGDLETRVAFLYCNVICQSAKEELIKLKFSSKEIQRIIFLLSLLDNFTGKNLPTKFRSVSSYKSFMALVKNHSPDPWTHTLEQFIHLTEAIGYPSRLMFAEHEDIVVFSKKEMQLNGNDLLQMGIPQGPQIKELLDKCYLEILRNPEHNTKDFLINYNCLKI
jgi:tRNA nucleotidyltransferase (CCA-adding enzyme)